MIETGGWTILDLINYLVSVQHTVQLIEIEKLWDNHVFPKETTTEPNWDEDGSQKKVPKLKASDLYEPLDMFRNIGLLIIDWRGEDGRREWKADSKEGKRDTVHPSSILAPPQPSFCSAWV